jgi:serine/threonine protein kinase
MGAVYQATDARLKREVAIKIMLNNLFGNDKALQRFHREAEVSARLEHPNIVRIYDFGAVGTSGAYLVMEYLKGITGRHAIARDECIAPAVVARWMDGLLAGLELAHAAGVVHRDLKPENLLLVQDGEDGEQVKILDFGLAKVKLLHIAEAEQLTVAGVTMGTLGYMSPEQVAGGDVDLRTDIYAIGTIVIEMLTGSIPAEDEDPESMLTDAVEGDVETLATVLRTARAHQKAHRYASAGDLRKELAKALSNVRAPDYVMDRATLLRRLGVDPSLPSKTAV